MLCLPLLPMLIERLTPSGLSPSSGSSLRLASVSPSHPLVAFDARWSLAIAALWLAASVARAFGLAGHAIRMRRLWLSANPAAAWHGDVMGQRVASWPVEVCVTRDLDRPCVIGFFRPRILIPAWLLDRLTPADLEHLVLHEWEHLRRRDDWANLVQKLCLVAFPLNPALWWIERRLCAEREMACDDGVVGQTQAPRAYAACLASLAEKGLQHRAELQLRGALSLGAWQRRSELAGRVHRLLRRQPRLNPAASTALVALVGCGLVAGTFALARSPQLVVFVAPPNPQSNTLSASAQMPGAQPVSGDVRTDFVQGADRFPVPGTQPFRAVKTIAVLPAAQTNSLPRNGKSTSRAVSPASADGTPQANHSSPSGHSLASLIPAMVAAGIKAQQARGPEARQVAQSTEDPAAQASWIVLTTFEEVQTASSNGDVQGDAVISETSSTPAAPGRNASTSITVTRLVLRLVQPATNTKPSPGAQPGSNVQPSSNSAQPVAIPYRDGWFVIQL